MTSRYRDASRTFRTPIDRKRAQPTIPTRGGSQFRSATASFVAHPAARGSTNTMPSDIRSFFGGAPKPSLGSQGSQKKDEPAVKKPATKKSGRASRVIDDSDDDDDDDEQSVKYA
jgi:hypothetical protein